MCTQERWPSALAGPPAALHPALRAALGRHTPLSASHSWRLTFRCWTEGTWVGSVLPYFLFPSVLLVKLLHANCSSWAHIQPSSWCFLHQPRSAHHGSQSQKHLQPRLWTPGLSSLRSGLGSLPSCLLSPSRSPPFFMQLLPLCLLSVSVAFSTLQAPRDLLLRLCSL